MNLTPEVKAQLQEQKKQCVFCKLISGEMPAKKVFEDEKTLAMLDIYPAVKGHVLFMPKEHYPLMPYFPAEDFAHFFSLVPALAKAVQDGIVSIGINIFIANGATAGQQSGHFQIHLLPRDEGDSFFNFIFKREVATKDSDKKILKHNLPLMMNDHFIKNPTSWHSGAGKVPDFLKAIYSFTSSRTLMKVSRSMMAGQAPSARTGSSPLLLFRPQTSVPA